MDTSTYITVLENENRKLRNVIAYLCSQDTVDLVRPADLAESVASNDDSDASSSSVVSKRRKVK